MTARVEFSDLWGRREHRVSASEHAGRASWVHVPERHRPSLSRAGRDLRTRSISADRYSTETVLGEYVAREVPAMIELVRRTFEVDAPLDDVWANLVQLESWPAWAKHVRAIAVTPAGLLTANSEVRMRLKTGMRSTLRVEEFNPPHYWSWVGKFVSIRVHYHHRLEAVADRTRLTWNAEAEGVGVTLIRAILASILSRYLDGEIENLQAQFAGSA